MDVVVFELVTAVSADRDDATVPPVTCVLVLRYQEAEQEVRAV